MALIREQALADIIAQSLTGNEIDDHALDSTLRTCKNGCDPRCYRCPGINFDYTSGLVLLLLKRAYTGLAQTTTPTEYATRVARAIHVFAREFSNKTNSMCYPHFLLHGIELPTTQQTAEKIEDNARIIHETRASKHAHQNARRISLPHELYLGASGGDTDDYFSTCYYLAREGTIAGPSHSYLAKFSIFRDVTNKTIVGLTVQGQTASTHRNKDGNAPKNKERGRNYARLTATLGMDPRTYTIQQVMDIARANGFEHAKVIRPHAHPFALENHSGFTGKYEHAIRAAGINTENGCYLETKLR